MRDGSPKMLLVSLLRWCVALPMPIFLILTASRLMIGDWYPRFEYDRPGFPPDSYGWSLQQRLELALPSIHFLNSPEPPEQAISMLAAQRKPETGGSLFTDDELSHMVDVKRLIDKLWHVQEGAGILILGALVVLLWRPTTRRSGYLAIMAGGILTTLCLLVLGIFVLAGFDTFFVEFHEIFFPQGNWTFNYTDSLIRLFPETFWSDAGTMITAGSLAAGILAGAVGGWLWQRKAAVSHPDGG
jgi:integral membrane protein (TIGR01906 family)